MDRAFSYTESHPLATEDDYPYIAKTHGLFGCQAKSHKGVVGATGYSDVKHGSAPQLKAALNKGPVSIAIEADKTAFQGYSTLVVLSPAVLAVPNLIMVSLLSVMALRTVKTTSL